jgi:hypothetical protein
MLGIYAVYLYFNPYDEVTTIISGIPPDTTRLCVVADKPGGPEVMLWSLNKVFPFTMHPDKCVVSLVDREQSTHQARVRWVNSGRIGVLRRTKSGKWFLAWFDPPKSNLKGRSLLFGGGTWLADIGDADEEQPVPDEKVRAMGMQPSWQDE